MTTTTQDRAKELTQLTHDILSTAVEFGIGYWATVTQYKWTGITADAPLRVEPVTGFDHENEAHPTFAVSAADIKTALRKMRDNSFAPEAVNCWDGAVPPHWRKFAAAALAVPAEADYDAIGADVVFQYAAFGKLIYG